MRTKILFTLIIAILFNTNIFSQEKEEYNIMIMGVPQYLINNGLRVDIDKNIKGTNKWIVLSPQLYNAESPAVVDLTYRTFDIEKVVGAGLGIDYKYIFSLNSNAEGVYLSAGASYNYYQISTNGIKWIPETAGSNKYIQEAGIFDTRINKMGVQAILGFQSKLADDFFIDFFIGFGIRLSIENTEDNGITDLSRFAGDYGYSGTNLVTGIRFGLGF